MDIYLLRHAIAVERGTPGYGEDSLRPLTSKGREKMHLNALGMKALGLSFELIFTSPYIRALDTAKIVAHTFNIKEDQIVITENLKPESSLKNIIAEINTLNFKVKRILLVGHEPHLSELISFLLTGHQTLPLQLKKGGLCHLNSINPWNAGSATLNSLLTPSQLRQMHSRHKQTD